MTYLFLFALGAFIGWAVGSGNHKAIWAWLVAAIGGAVAFAEPLIEAVKGLF